MAASSSSHSRFRSARSSIMASSIPATLKNQPAPTVAAYDAYAAVRTKGKHMNAKPDARSPAQGTRRHVRRLCQGDHLEARRWTGRDQPDVSGNAASRGRTAREPALNRLLSAIRTVPLHRSRRPHRPAALLAGLSGEPARGDRRSPCSHHGGNDVAHPSLVAGLKPRIAIVNNGQTKGGGAETLEMLSDDEGHRGCVAASSFAD